MLKLFDNMTDSKLFVEFYKEQNITINSSTNNFGQLVRDDNNNELNQPIDFGENVVKLVDTYTFPRKLLLYNNREWGIYEVGEETNIHFDFDNGTFYRIDADMIFPNTFDNVATFTFDPFPNDTIFKVFLNGREVTEYTFNGATGTVTIVGDSTRFVDIVDNDMFMVTHRTSQDLSGGSATLKYDGFDNVFEWDAFMEGCNNFEQFPTILEMGDYLSNNASIKKTVVKSKDGFEDSPTITTVSDIANSMSIEQYISTRFNDIIVMAGNQRFRVLMYNQYLPKMFIFNNCQLNDGHTIRQGKEYNVKVVSFDFGNYMEISADPNEIGYGDDLYGIYEYGGHILFNSRRTR